MPNIQEVKEAVDKMGQTFEEGRREFDAKMKEAGDATTGEVKDLLEKATADMDAKYTDLEEKQKQLNAALNRKRFDDAPTQKKHIAHKEGQALRKWMKSHEEKAGAAMVDDILGQELLAESKDLSVGDDTQAGFAVRSQIEQMIDASVTEISPFRQFSQVITLTQSDRMERLVNQKGGVGATRDGEDERSTNEDTGNPTLTDSEIAAKWMRASVNATGQLLDDAGFDIVSWTTGEASEDFSAKEDLEVILGRGAGRNQNEARGILTYGAGTTYGTLEQIDSGVNGGFAPDTLLELVGSLKEAYHMNARFYARRQTIFTQLFTLKDAEDQYYLVPNWREGVQFRLLGFPVHMNPHMPAAATDSLSLAFGDFGRGYTIVDRAGLKLVRDDLTGYPLVKLRFARRMGGDVANFEAIKIQKLAV